MTKTTPLQSQPDIYTRITNQIIAAIEAGADAFQMPWHFDGASARPVNATTGKAYRGANVLALWCAASDAGYSSDQWATYKQWSEKGAQVRKGEKSSSIVFWKSLEGQESADAQPEGDEGNGAGSRRFVARSYNVFNAEQIEGYQAPVRPQRPDVTRLDHADSFFNALGADIRHGGGRAYYRPATDHIQMPPFEAFRNTVAYYSTLSHEVTHWTGAKTRLERDLNGRFGNEAYAAEELIAELGAAFLCADLGLANEPRPDHAAYVANWLQVLKNDKRAIFTAAAKAQQAVDFAHDLQPQPRGEPEPEPEEPMLSATKPGQFVLNF
jgi:antirestriction protein ArdC